MSARAASQDSADPQRRPGILSFGYAVSLLVSRERAFVEAGFTVDSAASFDEAVAILEAKHHDILVIGHRVPEDERNRLAALFRARNPEGRVVFLYLGSIQNAGTADAVISVSNPAADLAVAISHQIQRARAS